MIRQNAESFTVEEPVDKGRDDNNVIIKGWTDPVTVNDAVIYRSPEEISEVDRADKRIWKARLTTRRWVPVTPYARVTFDGYAWSVVTAPRRTQNPYTGSRSQQVLVQRTTG